MKYLLVFILCFIILFSCKNNKQVIINNENNNIIIENNQELKNSQNISEYLSFNELIYIINEYEKIFPNIELNWENKNNKLLLGTKWTYIEEEPDDDERMPPIVIEFMENGYLHDRMPNDGHSYEQKDNILLIYWNQKTAISIGYFESENIIKGNLHNIYNRSNNFRIERIIEYPSSR